MESSGHRPATAGTHSGRRSADLSNDSSDVADGLYRSPARPSTHRSTNRDNSSPRTKHVASVADQESGRRSNGGGTMSAAGDSGENDRSEIAALRQKLSDSEIAKIQAQVQLKRQEADVVKLERYITQLIDERGGLGPGVMENIVRELEKSSLMKRTQKQIIDLKSELVRKQQEVVDQKAMQHSERLVKLVEEKEALIKKVEKLITEKHEATVDLSSSGRGNELERLRAQNSTLLTEIRRLRIDLDAAKIHASTAGCKTHMMSADGRLIGNEDNGECLNIVDRDSRRSVGGQRNLNSTCRDRNGSWRNDRSIRGNSASGPLFYEGQTVQIHRTGSESWPIATIEAVRSTVEEGVNNGTYLYMVWYAGGGREDGVPGSRIRAAEGATSDGPSNSSTDMSSKAIPATPAEEAGLRYEEKREELLAKARAAVPKSFEPGNIVLAKHSGLNSNNAWGVGVVANVDQKGLHCDINFHTGDFETNIPSIFVRHWGGSSGIFLSSAENFLLPGDAVLAHRDGERGDGSWFPAKVKERNGPNGKPSITFVGEEASITSTRQTKVLPLYLSLLQEEGCQSGRPEVPRNPPPPTKAVRAKKHHEGDIVLACVPKFKAWTPALIIGTEGRGRYSVEWADGTRVDSLLFMHIASYEGPGQKSNHLMASATTSRLQGVARRDGGDGEGGNCTTSQDGHSDHQDAIGERHKYLSSNTGQPQVRVRQRQLNVGEPVLAKGEDQTVWVPGSVKRVCGGGKYDLDLTDGSTAEGLSFFFIRTLDIHDTSAEGSNSSDEITDGPSRENCNVGDSVYVLRHGHAIEGTSYDLYDRDMWRVGTIATITNGRFTVCYDQEEGKPREARIAPERIRPRQIIRQKAVEKGDAVLALSKTRGRGWLMGAVAGRHEGKYTIIFADGSKEEDIRFVNLRRVVDREVKDSKYIKARKPPGRPIRQRSFRVKELALAKHPDTHKWGIVQVLEAHPSGRYDLEFLENNGALIMGASFTNMRHLDVAGVASPNPVVLTPNSTDGNGNVALMNTAMAPPSGSAKSWDGCHKKTDDHHEEEETYAERKIEWVSGLMPAPDTEIFDVNMDVCVLRRGKKESADLQDTRSWRPGRVVSVKSNGTFAVQYDSEKGSPTEDHVAENRLRIRTSFDKSSGHRCGRGHDNIDEDDEKFVEGDIVLAIGEGQEGKGSAMVTVAKVLTDNVYCMEYLDGSGTFKMESNQLRHLRQASEGGRRVTLGGQGLPMPKRAVKMRKLHVGEIVLGKRTNGISSDGGSSSGGEGWFAGKIMAALGYRNYSVLFAGETEATRTHFTWIQPLKINGVEGNARQEENSRGQGRMSASLAAENGRGTDPRGKRRNGGVVDQSAVSVLRVAEVAFDLAIAASVARRTTPHLVLAVGERGQTAHEATSCPIPPAGGGNSSQDNLDGNRAGFLTRGPARAGTRNPSWKAKDGGVFWLSLDGLAEPELYIGVRNSRAAQAGGGDGFGDSSREAMGEVCVPVPEAGVPAGTTVEIELEEGAGTVKLEWGTHDHVY